MQAALRTLGLPGHAGAEQARQAFLQLSKTCHPDVAGDSDAVQARYREILESHRFLKRTLKKTVVTESTPTPHPMQASLFAATSPADGAGQGISPPPPLSVAQALERLQASHNPWLRVVAVKSLAGRMSRKHALLMLSLLGREQHPDVSQAMAQVLSQSDVAVVKVGLRIYLARRASHRLRHDFAAWLPWRRDKNQAARPSEPVYKVPPGLYKPPAIGE